MKFGKEFSTHLEKTLPQWREKFLSYKLLKKLLKNIPSQRENNPLLQYVHECFVALLNEELEKFNDFYVEKEEDFIIRFQALKERIESVKERGNNGLFTSVNEFSEEMMAIRKDFVAIHGEMVLLKSYSSLNFAGLIKILKKYDKRTGESLSVPFTRFALHQPFFVTEPLSQLVRECEENREDLFPIEAEVIDSNTTDLHQTDPRNTFILNPPSEDATLTLGKENLEIYWSTIAAISVIQNLKKASKTYNPLSMSYIFGNTENESMGSVTEENSPCNSVVMTSDDEDDGMSSP